MNVAGNWAGATTDTDYTPPNPGMATLTLTEDSAGKLNGSINFSQGFCSGGFDVVGNLNGAALSLLRNTAANFEPSGLGRRHCAASQRNISNGGAWGRLWKERGDQFD